MRIATFPGMFALRYPFRSPDEEGSGGQAIDLEAEFGPEPAADAPAAEEPAPAAEEPPAEEAPAEEAPAEEEPPAEEAPAEEPAAEDDDEQPPAANKDWKDRQIIKARDDAKKAREEAASEKARADALEALYGEPNEDGTPKNPVITPEQARADALKVVRQEQYFEKLNTSLGEMDAAGGKAFPKTWETRIAAAREIFSDEMAAKPHFIEAVTDLPNSAAVYHDLAGNPDEFERVLNLPPVKMGMELAKLSTKLAQAKPIQVSRAPAPIKPLDGPKIEERSLEALADATDEESMEAFDRRMRAEEKKRFAEQN